MIQDLRLSRRPILSNSRWTPSGEKTTVSRAEITDENVVLSWIDIDGDKMPGHVTFDR